MAGSVREHLADGRTARRSPASTSSSARRGPRTPRSTSSSTHTAANGLVTEYGITRVSSRHGRVRAGVGVPAPQVDDPRAAVPDGDREPASRREAATTRANSSATGSKPARHRPLHRACGHAGRAASRPARMGRACVRGYGGPMQQPASTGRPPGRRPAVPRDGPAGRRRRERQRSHGDLLNLVAGQPSTPAPAPVREAARRALDEQVLGLHGRDPGSPSCARRSPATTGGSTASRSSRDDVVVTTGLLRRLPAGVPGRLRGR